MNISVLDTIRLPILGAPGPLDACKLGKEKFGGLDFAKGLKEISENITKEINDRVAAGEKLTSIYNSYLDTLQTRKVAVQDKLNATQSGIQIGNNLPLLLFILGTACVATILGVKLFDKDIQMEWVASGQVIQFVTVMILLSVILALGLSGSLKENTLGTLLGGLAGYVLAQGVGKSAAREATRVAIGAGQSTALPPAASNNLPTKS